MPIKAKQSLQVTTRQIDNVFRLLCQAKIRKLSLPGDKMEFDTNLAVPDCRDRCLDRCRICPALPKSHIPSVPKTQSQPNLQKYLFCTV